MTDDEFELQKERLKTLAERWIKPIGLGWWTIDIQYVREPSEFRVNGEPEPRTAASTNADWRYADAVIRWNVGLLANHDDAELERMFVHELMHVFLCEMHEGEQSNEQADHEERVATTLCKAFLWLRDALLERPGADSYPLSEDITVQANGTLTTPWASMRFGG